MNICLDFWGNIASVDGGDIVDNLSSGKTYFEKMTVKSKKLFLTWVEARKQEHVASMDACKDCKAVHSKDYSHPWPAAVATALTHGLQEEALTAPRTPPRSRPGDVEAVN